MKKSKFSLREDAVPAEFLASQVDALFSDMRSFTIGSAGVVAAMLAVTWRTGSWVIGSISVGFALLAYLRLLMMRRYQTRRDDTWTVRDFSSWDRFYHLGATTHITAIGAFCLSTFCIAEDAPDRTIALATIIAYMAGIPGRNFANAAGVNAQIIAGGTPIVIAMLVAGRAYTLVTVIVLIPFFVALRVLSARLRQIFVQATDRATELKALAARFDTALCNMSHGLAMFDPSGALEICNERFLSLLQLPIDEARVGEDGGTLFLQAFGTKSPGHLKKLSENLSNPSADAVEIEIHPSTFLEFSFESMQKGGSVVLVQDISERKRAAERINQLALFDELTQISNRSNFKSHLIDAVERSSGAEKYALLFIDLDQFKQVNDTLGHHRGDLLLVEVAKRLRLGLPGDLVARFGGDEFVVLRRINDPLSDVEEVAARIIRFVSGTYQIDGHDVDIGASLGISLFPAHDTNADELLKKADMALYAAKANGRGSYMLFEKSMDVEARAKSELEHDLHRAMQQSELDIFFQPIFDVRSGRYTLCEALLRWKHPTRGYISPAEFIPVAEETGLIIEIGDWVLQQACLECTRWPSHMSVAVNISPLQFRRGDVVASVRNALASTQLDPRRLELELTESVLLRDITHTSLTMTLLAMLRVRLSLDDFGTGYSSLNYLHKLPLNKVKIDRSFLAGLGSDQKTGLMLGGLARLINELGLSLVIEGVETDEQLRLVADFADVSEVQGFLFSRPLCRSDVRRLLGVSPASAQPTVAA